MKQLVFISHIHEEQEIAIAFKELVEASFLGMIDVFVSSDGSSVSMGAKWLESISDALKKCAVEIVVCSPASVQRPWIQFEAGACWVRDIPVVPLCHSRLTPSSLPIPLNLLNGATATDKKSIELILPVLAKALGSNVPKADLDTFLRRTAIFEQYYTFWNICNPALALIKSFHADLLPHLKKGATVTIPLDEKQVAQVEKVEAFLRDNRIIDYQGRKKIILGPIPKFECMFAPMSELGKTLSAPECTL